MHNNPVIQPRYNHQKACHTNPLPCQSTAHPAAQLVHCPEKHASHAPSLTTAHPAATPAPPPTLTFSTRVVRRTSLLLMRLTRSKLCDVTRLVSESRAG